MRTSRAVLFYSVIGIFLAAAIITLLGIAGLIPVPERFLKPLFGALILELVAVVIGLFKATDWFGGGAVAAEAIEGGWWQVVRVDEDQNVLAFVTIAYSDEEQQIVLEGEAFTREGEPHSRFWSLGGSVNASSMELHYVWKGDHDQNNEDYSGVGYIRFEKPDRDGKVDAADGWFTSGNIDRKVVTFRRKVEYWRASKSDTKTMRARDRTEDRRRLALATYSKAKGASQPQLAG